MFTLIAALAVAAAPAESVNVVMVHGAFADGSAWNKVASKIEAMKMKAWAVQLPETSFEDDVAATKRMIAAAKGPVVLVGHSYGGVVITAAADGDRGESQPHTPFLSKPDAVVKAIVAASKAAPTAKM